MDFLDAVFLLQKTITPQLSKQDILDTPLHMSVSKISVYIVGSKLDNSALLEAVNIFKTEVEYYIDHGKFSKEWM